MTPLHIRAHRAAFAVLRPHLGDELAAERAAQWTCCFDPLDLPTEQEVTASILASGWECYGSHEVDEDEAESLAARVVLVLSSVR